MVFFSIFWQQKRTKIYTKLLFCFGASRVEGWRLYQIIIYKSCFHCIENEMMPIFKNIILIYNTDIYEKLFYSALYKIHLI